MMRNLIPALAIGACMSFAVQKDKKLIPPGTVQISETFFADETEVSNMAWMEYESWTKTKFGANSAEHLSTLPDTLVWREKNATNEPYVQHYYRHAAYRNYPVVGISYEQAVAFCKWRTERVKESLMLSRKKEYSITYRLPTKEEWELLSNNGTNIFPGNGKNEKGISKLNCMNPNDTASYAGANDITAPVYSYWQNRFGLFNTFGNVSEMVSEKGISKGGSWRHDLESCRAGKNIAYSKPEAWLGLRCVCVTGS